MTNSRVQLPPDSTGSYVRTLSVSETDTSGNTYTVLQQVMTLADAAGNVVDPSGIAALPELLIVSKQVRTALLLLLNIASNGRSYDINDLGGDD